ncbi:MAG TPA: FeS assembly protein, partial [Chthoniobacteraceae bacterium]|nr:FeS assembly protein [Chthoniobacteraceae bacterium]
ALSLSGEALAAPLGALPPMKIHCAQLVEGALRSALADDAEKPQEPASPPAAVAPTLLEQLQAGAAADAGGAPKAKIVLKPRR